MSADKSGLFSAGFFVTRKSVRSSHKPRSGPVISASRCINDFMPDTWCIEWAADEMETRISDALVFNLDSRELDEVIKWSTSIFDTKIGWPNVCFSLETAREYASRFLKSGMDDLLIFELGLPGRFVDIFIEASGPTKQNEGHAAEGCIGIHQALTSRRLVHSRGSLLGFEPLVYDGQGVGCSWLCSATEKDAGEKIGVTLNSNSLIDNLDDACRCVEYLCRDEVPTEPGLWLPWAILEHEG